MAIPARAASFVNCPEDNSLFDVGTSTVEVFYSRQAAVPREVDPGDSC